VEAIFSELGKQETGLTSFHFTSLDLLPLYYIPNVLNCNFDCCVLYGCGTWSPEFREERELRILENRLLRKELGPNKKEVKGNWMKQRIWEIHDRCFSPNDVRMIR
jgi:hypothetical protein